MAMATTPTNLTSQFQPNHLITTSSSLLKPRLRHSHFPSSARKTQISSLGVRRTSCKASEISVAEDFSASGENWVPVVPLGALPRGERRVIIQDGETILLLWYKNEVFAIENRSPAEGAYTEGLLNAKLTQDGCIVCPTTDSTFDLRTGDIKEWYPNNPVLRVLTPALRKLFVYAVKTDDENIYISMTGNLGKSDASAEIVFSGKAQPGVTATNVNVDEDMSSGFEESSGDKKFKGVRRRKWGKWVSEIRVPGTQERLWLGSYSTAEAAAVAHDVAYYCLRRPITLQNLNFPLTLPSGVRPDMSPRSIQKAASDAGMAGDAQFISGKTRRESFMKTEEGFGFETEFMEDMGENSGIWADGEGLSVSDYI